MDLSAARRGAAPAAAVPFPGLAGAWSASSGPSSRASCSEPRQMLVAQVMASSCRTMRIAVLISAGGGVRDLGIPRGIRMPAPSMTPRASLAWGRRPQGACDAGASALRPAARRRDYDNTMND